VKATSITSTTPGDGRIDQTTFRRLMSHVVEGELRGAASPLILFQSAYVDGVAVRFGSSELQVSGEVIGQ